MFVKTQKTIITNIIDYFKIGMSTFSLYDSKTTKNFKEKLFFIVFEN